MLSDYTRYVIVTFRSTLNSLPSVLTISYPHMSQYQRQSLAPPTHHNPHPGFDCFPHPQWTYIKCIFHIASSAMAIPHTFCHVHINAFAIVVLSPTIFKKLVVVWQDLALPSCDQPLFAIPQHKKNVIPITASCNTDSLP